MKFFVIISCLLSFSHLFSINPDSCEAFGFRKVEKKNGSSQTSLFFLSPEKVFNLSKVTLNSEFRLIKKNRNEESIDWSPDETLFNTSNLENLKSCYSPKADIVIFAHNVYIDQDVIIDLNFKNLIIYADSVEIKKGLKVENKKQISIYSREIKVDQDTLDRLTIRTHSIDHFFKLNQYFLNRKGNISSFGYFLFYRIAEALSYTGQFEGLNEATFILNQLIEGVTKKTLKSFNRFSGVDLKDIKDLVELKASEDYFEEEDRNYFDVLLKIQSLTYKIERNKSILNNFGNYISRSQINELSESCKNSINISKNSYLKKAGNAKKLLGSCSESERNEMLAITVPYESLGDLWRVFETLYASFDYLWKKKESIQANSGLLNSESEAYKILEQTFLEKVESNKIKIARIKLNLERTQKEIENALKAVSHINDQLSRHTEYQKVLESLPPEAMAASMLGDIGEISSTLIPFAGFDEGNSDLENGALFVKVVASIAGWVGNKIYEDQMREFNKIHGEIRKKLQLLAGTQEVEAMAFKMSHLLLNVKKIRSDQIILALEAKGIFSELSQYQKNLNILEERGYEIAKDSAAEIAVLDELLEDRKRELYYVINKLLFKMSFLEGKKYFFNNESLEEKTFCQKFTQSSQKSLFINLSSCRKELMKNVLFKGIMEREELEEQGLGYLNLGRSKPLKYKKISFSKKKNKKMFESLKSLGEMTLVFESGKEDDVVENNFIMYQQEKLKIFKLFLMYDLNLDQCSIDPFEIGNSFFPFTLQYDGYEKINDGDEAIYFRVPDNYEKAKLNAYSKELVNSVVANNVYNSNSVEKFLTSNLEPFYNEKLFGVNPIKKWKLKYHSKWKDQLASCFSEVKLLIFYY